MFECVAGEAERTCCACGETKPIDEFLFRVKSKGLRYVRCAPCKRDYEREYYATMQSRRKQVRKIADRRDKTLKEFFEDSLAGASCSCCQSQEGLRYHRPGKRTPQQMISHNASIANIEKAIADSVILCVSCRVKATHPAIAEQMTPAEATIAAAAIERAIERAGSVKKLTQALNISMPAIFQWRSMGRIPERRVARVSEITGIPERELRPDLFRESASNIDPPHSGVVLAVDRENPIEPVPA
jgi:DNA-binding transcriptional regulator YdaS (Cro superfamily)